MKSLILKDLYNIWHNAKTMLFILILFTVAFKPMYGVTGYIVVCGVLCSMMIITTFSFDNISSWTRYAMVMPVSRKDLVLGKFIVLIIFCTFGALFGTVGSFITELIFKKGVTVSVTEEVLISALSSWAIALVFGSISIPLTFKFGTEKARLLLFVSFFVPAAICVGIYQLLITAGVQMTDSVISILLLCSPAAALLWCFAMYEISYRIFKKKEL